jgi:hypothetical protein
MSNLQIRIEVPGQKRTEMLLGRFGDACVRNGKAFSARAPWTMENVRCVSGTPQILV